MLLFPLSKVHSFVLEDSVIIAYVNAYAVTLERPEKMNERMKEGNIRSVKVYLFGLEKRKEKGVRKILKSNYEYIRNCWNIFGHKKTKRRREMENRTYYYARVSTQEQNLDRQLEAFRALGAGERDIIVDKQSGKNLDRAGYQALKNAILRPGDTLVIKSLDRLSRNKSDIHSELQFFKKQGIRIKVIDLPTTMVDLSNEQGWILEMVNNILIEVLGTIAEQERITLRQRQSEGIAAAKARGKQLGRPAIQFPENWDEVYQLWLEGKITAKEAMTRTGTKRTSFYKMVQKWRK